MFLTKSKLAVAAAVLALAVTARAQAGKKVIVVNSYHEGYEWSDGEEKGSRTVLEAAGVKIEYVRMDTKRHQDEAFRKQAGAKARAKIDAEKPDAVILYDDIAVQYLLVPYYKTSSIPFVFAGVNWDASRYGLGKNATGMLEVSLVKELLEGLKTYAKGNRVGFLTVDSETERIEGPYYKKALGLNFSSEVYVKTFAEWKAAFVKMQSEADVIFLGNYAGINDWNDAAAAEFHTANAKVPTGTIYDFMMPYAMLGYTKIAEEQGEHAGKTVLEIFKGKSPGSIPVVGNKKAKIFVNAKLASKAGIVFKPELVRTAQVFAAR